MRPGWKWVKHVNGTKCLRNEGQRGFSWCLQVAEYELVVLTGNVICLRKCRKQLGLVFSIYDYILGDLPSDLTSSTLRPWMSHFLFLSLSFFIFRMGRGSPMEAVTANVCEGFRDQYTYCKMYMQSVITGLMHGWWLVSVLALSFLFPPVGSWTKPEQMMKLQQAWGYFFFSYLWYSCIFTLSQK